MAENSKIQWTSHTFNPWRGCTKVSAGCAHCYAETLSGRNPGTLGVWGPNGTRVVASEAMWCEPVKWNAAAAAEGVRKRVFCASLADVFEQWAGPMQMASGVQLWRRAGSGEWTTSDHYRDTVALTMDDVRMRLFTLIAMTPFLDWLILTKRPEYIAPTLTRLREGGLVASGHFPWPNVWLGTSVENQQTADERIPHLLAVPAKVRFLSCEPLLGPVDLTAVQTSSRWPGKREAAKLDALRGFTYSRREPFTLDGFTYNNGESAFVDEHDTGRIDWVIVGGESGPGARPFNLDWARSMRNQCKAADVPFFMKQMGALIEATNGIDPIDQFPGDVAAFRQGKDESTALVVLHDRKGGDPAEWPADLRVREFPTSRAGSEADHGRKVKGL